MNRTQLAALLQAGLITPDQFHQALSSITAAGEITARPTLQMRMPAVAMSVDAATRTVTGVITAYDVLVPSHVMILEAGCMQPREPLDRVKLLRDHNHADPLGYATSIDGPAENASFYIPEGENGDRALQEATDKLRDGFSVGFSILEYFFDEEYVLHVQLADLYEVSLVAVPAVADAGVTHVAAALAATRKESTTMNRAQLAAALAAGTITQEQHDAALAALTAVLGAPGAPAPEAPAPVSAVAAGPELQTTPPTALEVTQRPTSLQAAVQTISQAMNSMDPNAVRLALATILPADDAGAGFLRDDWMGELWRAEDVSRPWIDAIGVPEQMTSLKGKGWRWVDEPEVEEYTGNVTEVASNDIATEEGTFTGFRIAAGWKVDRVFEDFADPEFTSAFWAAAMQDYKRKSNAGIRTRLLAAASAPAGTVTAGGVTAVLKQVVRDVRAIEGGRANRIFLGDDLYEELEDLPTDNLPLWLKSATIGLDIAEGSADIGSLRILNDSTLAAKQVAAFDNRALKVKEKSPLQIKALDVAFGAIDLGFFGYLRLDDHDARVVVKRTYVPA